MTSPNNFDWGKASKSGAFASTYSQEKRAEMEKMIDSSFSAIKEKEVISATVVEITPREVILNIGFKSDGFVPLSEFKDNPDLKIGDKVDVYIENQEDASGQLILSRKKAKMVSAWKSIEDAHAQDTVINSFVKRRTKGGLIVDIHGFEAFLPGSQIDVKPIRDFDAYVNKYIEVKVIKINYENDNVVVSHKVLIEKDMESQRQQILTNLEKGQVLEGIVKNMTNFGAFIDLGGVDGLLHITDISWTRINHPNEVLELDQKINVVVTEFDEEKKRISLGMKQLQAHPWDSLSADYVEGTKLKGKVVNIADYGIFLEIFPGVEGLIHVTEMSWSQHPQHTPHPQDMFKLKDEVEAVILTLDRETYKMSLGIKQLNSPPWENPQLAVKYATGSKHKGVVRNMTQFGLFIELEEGIDGLIHLSDLSWTRKIKSPSEFAKVGDSIDVIVLAIDVENKRLSLGHKQLEENPWDTFETIFTSDSIHRSTIISKTDKGAMIELPYGVEGFSTLKNLTKEDGSIAEAGETLDFKVLEFSKEDKRILVSHTKSFQQEEIKKEKEPTATKEVAPKKETKKSSVSEKTTMGDEFSALATLKEQMEEKEAAADEKPKKAKKKE